MTIFPRALTARLMEALSDTPVVVLNGARQVGKTTRQDGPLGPLLETFVVNEIRKQMTWSANRPSLFHFGVLLSAAPEATPFGPTMAALPVSALWT